MSTAIGTFSKPISRRSTHKGMSISMLLRVQPVAGRVQRPAPEGRSCASAPGAFAPQKRPPELENHRLWFT